VQFALVALDVAQATVPRYRTKFSKHKFTQPQLLAILCLMALRRLDLWRSRGPLERTSRIAAGFATGVYPDYPALYRFVRPLDEAAIARALNEVVQRIPLPGPRRRAWVAVDATGLSQGAIGTLLRGSHAPPHPATYASAQVAEVAEVAGGGRHRPPRQPIGLVLADAEFDSELNHTPIRQPLHARSVLPAKRGKSNWKTHGVRAQMRANFPRHL
jgi:hypothetical protein